LASEVSSSRRLRSAMESYIAAVAIIQGSMVLPMFRRSWCHARGRN